MKSDLYFRHDVYALEDTDIMKLVFTYQESGYGVFWAIIERLTAEPSHKLMIDDLVMQLSMRLRTDCKLANDIINFCCEHELLNNEDGLISNDRVFRQCEAMEERSQQCRSFAQARWQKSKSNATVMPKQSIGNANNNNNKNNNNNNIDEVLRLYSEICTSLPKVVKLTDTRKTHCKTLLNKFNYQDIQECFHKAQDSEFLRNGSGSWNGATFDWLINSSNFVKVLEGNYDNKKTSYVVSSGELTKDSNGGFKL